MPYGSPCWVDSHMRATAPGASCVITCGVCCVLAYASLLRKRQRHRWLMRCRVGRSVFQPPGDRGTTSSAERPVGVTVSARTDGGAVVQHATLAWPQASGVPYFFRNTSTRPAVSTIVCRPVKNGWQLAHTVTRILGTVERACTVALQVHVISVSMDAGWCEFFIGPPLMAAFSACHVCYAAADTSARSFSAKTCLGTTPTV